MTALAGLAAGLAAWTAGAAGRPSTQRAGLSPPRGTAAFLGGAATALFLGVWCVLQLPLAPLIAISTAGCVANVVVHRRRQLRRRAGLEADVITFCFAVAGDVRTGRMPGEAVAASVAQLGPLAAGMTATARAAGHGAPVEIELLALAQELSSRRLETVAAVWAAAAATGARVADVLERVAIAFAAEDEARAELDAVAAGPRATAMVLCLLPLFGVALGTVMGSDPLRLLLHSGFGVLLVACAALLDGCGLVWVHTITGRALRG